MAEIKTGKFTLEEVDKARSKIDNGKTPGTDGIPGELIKWLNTKEAIEIILGIVNDMWEIESIPSESEIARVVTIYKKSNPDLPENYRPIAILQTIYKIYARLVQNRLAEAIDDRIWKTQFGFRKNKSTSQPISMLRRIQDYMESSGERITLLFLDWEKAFDEIDHEELIKAIGRFNLPDKIIRIVKSFYEDPQFFYRR